MLDRMREFLSPVVFFSNNPLSFLGVLLVTTSVVFWLFLLPTTLTGERHPYVGILAFLVLPGLFFLGLALIPIGIILRKRHRARPLSFPPLDFKNVAFRRMAIFILVATSANVLLGSVFTYKAVHYMDSVSFCGLTCHKVMRPEWSAYQNSAHSRVDCVQCHIGPGASFFVKSKISGLWQVVAVTLDIYPRPIEVPIPNLRPARETCEQCHWPQKYGEDRLRVNHRYAEDEVNSHTKNVLLLRIGGGPSGPGIHGAHLGAGVHVRYRASDRKREVIPWVEYSNGRQSFEFLAEGADKAEVDKLETREMDCMDCHNRPSHAFETPEWAIDREMTSGAISPALPFAKKQGLALLKASYGSNVEAVRKIRSGWAAFYQSQYPKVYEERRKEVDAAAEVLAAIYNRNVFPEMRVTWGTYPNHIGHSNYTGCFRCHDERPSLNGGRTITQDCNTCHSLLAMDEAEPKILTDLGIGDKKTD